MAPYRRRMVNAARVRDDIVRLVHRGLPVPEFAQAVGSALLRAVPAEGTCLMTLDPATMLPTAEYVENGLPAAQQLRLVEIEVREPDYNKWTQLARSDQPAASLSDVTAGDLDRSLRQREIRRPGGFADELRAVLGSWGALYTEGWDREVRATGAAAKATKETINRKRIYPPLTGSREELFAAAAPTVQAPPPTYGAPR